MSIVYSICLLAFVPFLRGLLIILPSSSSAPPPLCAGQHLISKDMVVWTEVGAPSGFGGTGGMTIDDDGSIVAYAMSGGVKFWKATDDSASKWEQVPTPFPKASSSSRGRVKKTLPHRHSIYSRTLMGCHVTLQVEGGLWNLITVFSFSLAFALSRSLALSLETVANHLY